MKKGMFILMIVLVSTLFAMNTSAQDVIWVEDFGVCNTSDIVVPVWFNNDTSTIDAVGFHLSFDDSLISYSGIAAADETMGWIFTGSAIGGDLTVTGSGSAVDQYTEAILCNISFSCAACSTGNSSAFGFSMLADDLVGYTSTDGSFTWYDGCGITISDEIGCSDPVQVTVSVASTNLVDDFIIQIGFDADMLEFVSGIPTGLTADWVLLTAFEPTGSPGTVIIIGSTEYFGTPLLPNSTGDIVSLTFNVTCDTCDENDISALTIDQLEGDLASYLTTDGSFTYQCGSPGPGQLRVGYASVLVGLSEEIPIYFDDTPTDVDAFGFNLTFCSDSLEFVSIRPGDLTMGFDVFDANVSSPGVLTIGGYDPETADAIPAGSTGTIAYVEFLSSSGGLSHCTMEATDLTDDIAGWTTTSGLFSIITPLIPSLSIVGLLLALMGISVGIFHQKRNR